MTVTLVWATPNVDQMSDSDRLIVLCHAKGYRATHAGAILNPKGKPVLGSVRRDGYKALATPAFDGMKRGTVLWHRFVAYCFLGDRIFKHRLIRHINSNKCDNNICNLAPGSYTENRADVPRELIVDAGKKAGVISTKRLRKLTDQQVVEMREVRRATGLSFKVIAAQFGVTAMTAHRCITGQTWKEIA